MKQILNTMASMVDVKNPKFELAYVLATTCGKLVSTDRKTLMVVDNVPVCTPDVNYLLEVKKVTKPIIGMTTMLMDCPATHEGDAWKYPEWKRIVPSDETLRDTKKVALEVSDVTEAVCQIAQEGYTFNYKHVENLYKTKASLSDLTLHVKEDKRDPFYITGFLGDRKFIYIVMPYKK